MRFRYVLMSDRSLCFSASAAVEMKSTVFWVVTRREVVCNRRFAVLCPFVCEVCHFYLHRPTLFAVKMCSHSHAEMRVQPTASWRRVVLEQILVCHVIKFFACSSPFSQQLDTRSCPDQDIWSTPFHSVSLKSILVLSSHLRLGLPSGLLPSVSPPQRCMHFCLHALPISVSFTSSVEQYPVSSTNNDASLQSPVTPHFHTEMSSSALDSETPSAAPNVSSWCVRIQKNYTRNCAVLPADIFPFSQDLVTN